jgi:GNAT superfamily N-acetyltransferase
MSDLQSRITTMKGHLERAHTAAIFLRSDIVSGIASEHWDILNSEMEKANIIWTELKTTPLEVFKQIEEEKVRVVRIKEKIESIPEVYRNPVAGQLLVKIEQALNLGNPEEAFKALLAIQEPETPVRGTVFVEISPPPKPSPLTRMTSIHDISRVGRATIVTTPHGAIATQVTSLVMEASESQEAISIGDRTYTIPIDDGRYMALKIKPLVGLLPSAYRQMYNRVGRPHFWYERNLLSDTELYMILRDKKVELFGLFKNTSQMMLSDAEWTQIGFAELDRRADLRQVELAYFGLLPEYTGKGLGRMFLQRIVNHAWTYPGIRQLHVNTNTLDSPAALPLYQKVGFIVSSEKDIHLADPRLVWPDRMSLFGADSYPWPKNDLYQSLQQTCPKFEEK